MMRLVAIYRSATYSPGRHRSNDAAIMDETTARLAADGWSVERLGEGDVEAGILPDADLYLNMCQGRAASEELLELEARGARMINRPSSVLACHRHRLIPALTAARLPVPPTTICSTLRPVQAHDWPYDAELWVKRGDVHAQSAADVVRTDGRTLAATLRSFAERGVEQVAVQEHVPGPVLKFYGVAHSGFFHAFREDGTPVDDSVVALDALKELAFAAARAVRLQVFGGDAVVADRLAPTLVDLNDWPSFAPVRQRAAQAIARLAHVTLLERSPA